MALGLSGCCKVLCATMNFDLTKTLSHLTFQDFTRTFNKCLPDDSVSKFYSVFLITLEFSFYSGLMLRKKNGTKKVGHIYKFISCTGLAYTGRSLLSIALVILDL